MSKLKTSKMRCMENFYLLLLETIDFLKQEVMAINPGAFGAEQTKGSDMNDQPQQGPATWGDIDNPIVHIANILREDISIAHNSTDVSLRQPPINGDDHDSWGGHEKLDDWFYVAYSAYRATNRAGADAALAELAKWLKTQEAKRG